MSTPPATSIFDGKLIDRVPLLRKHRNLFLRWVKAKDGITKSRFAANIISSIILDFTRDYLSAEGQTKITTIAENLRRFESLIEEFRTGFVGKIYRDHLNHMVRTALIANQLVNIVRRSFRRQKIKTLPDRGKGLDKRALFYKSFPEEQARDLFVAALFHDAAYPVQESNKIFEHVVEALGKGYSILEYESSIPKLKRGLRGFDELQEQTCLRSEQLLKCIYDKPNHASIGAMEFLGCCLQKDKPAQRMLEIAAAICLHDSSLETKIKFSENPLAVLLIIADELQDWGRPVSHPDGTKTVPLDELHQWEVLLPRKKDRISCSMMYGEDDFPLLDVIHAKWLNLKRLVLDYSPFSEEFLSLNAPRCTISFPVRQNISFTSLVEQIISSGIRVKPRVKKRVWQVDSLSLSSEEVAKSTNLELEEVRNARFVLQKLPKVIITHKEDSINFSLDHQIFSFGRSSNNLIVKKSYFKTCKFTASRHPANIFLATITGKFIIYSF